jgi:maltose O-acetyltransferase
MSQKSEKEKMLTGELYNCLDPELKADRQQTKKLLWAFNHTEDEKVREPILHQLFGAVGENLIIWPPYYCSYGRNTYFGDCVFVNYNCTILDNILVRIGNHVMFGPSVSIYTAAHALQAEARIKGLEVAKPVTIEDNVWLGGGVIILPGVRIGKNAVVGAGAVVSRDVPANTIAVGNPARVLREIEQTDL